MPLRLWLVSFYLLFLKFASFESLLFGGYKRSDRLMSALGSAIGIFEEIALDELIVAIPVPVKVVEFPG